MDHLHQHERHPASIPAPPFWRSRYAIGLVVFGAAAGYFLLSEHRAHFLGALPFLILLACPLMHVFMHGGHSGHGRHAGRADDPQSLANPATTPAEKADMGNRHD